MNTNQDQFGFDGADAGMQMQSQEDAFADAGLIDPGMGGVNMMSGGSEFSNFGPKADDYTEEELVLLKEVEEANENRKRALYEKQQ